jgi:hypothetical protein
VGVLGQVVRWCTQHHPWRHKSFNLFTLTLIYSSSLDIFEPLQFVYLQFSVYFWRLRYRLFYIYYLKFLFLATTMPFVLWLLVYFWLLRCRLFTLYISGYFATICFNISAVYISGYFLAVCVIFLATAMLLQPACNCGIAFRYNMRLLYTLLCVASH